MKNTSGPPAFKRPSIRVVVEQHLDDARVLWSIRAALTSSPHVELKRLLRFDERLVAHLDGLVLAGADGGHLASRTLENPSPASMFVASVLALKSGDVSGLAKLSAVAAAEPDAARGMVSAFGWVPRSDLADIVKRCLNGDRPFLRFLGIAACAVQRVDPGAPLLEQSISADSDVQARALRAIGELGKRDMIDIARGRVSDDDAACNFWAAWSAVLLGDRGRALEALTETAFLEGPYCDRAFRLALQAMRPAAAHAVLQHLGNSPDKRRRLIQGSGIAADPQYVSWLIKHMAQNKTAQVAGEAFSIVTGADLALLDLERKPPENVESGPNDDAQDPNVDMDPDGDLPWPDVEKVEKWWAANESRFQKGTRYFMGKPVTREHCIDVLKNGYQRQRILAAHYLCLLEPGTPLFNTSAPAWRQQRLLAAM